MIGSIPSQRMFNQFILDYKKNSILCTTLSENLNRWQIKLLRCDLDDNPIPWYHVSFKCNQTTKFKHTKNWMSVFISISVVLRALHLASSVSRNLLAWENYRWTLVVGNYTSLFVIYADYRSYFYVITLVIVTILCSLNKII